VRTTSTWETHSLRRVDNIVDLIYEDDRAQLNYFFIGRRLDTTTYTAIGIHGHAHTVAGGILVDFWDCLLLLSSEKSCHNDSIVTKDITVE